MVRHSQKQIEEAGIGKVKESLWDLGEFADSYFETNDKTPLIDGEIFLYKKGGQSKANFLQKVECQIKSTKNKNVKKYQKFQQIDRVTLNGYKNLGGILLFVVWVNDMLDYTIYYQNLTPLYIEQLLKTTNAKKPAIPLTRFPDDPKRKFNVLKQVAFDLNAGHHTRLFKINSTEPDNVVIPQFMFELDDFAATMRNLTNQQLTVYGNYNGSLQPLATVKDEDIEMVMANMSHNEISFGELGTFPIRELITQRKGDFQAVPRFVTGVNEKIKISFHDISKNKNKITMEITRDSNVNAQVTNLKILQHLITKGTIKLNGNTFNLSSYIGSISTSIKKQLSKMLKSTQALAKFGSKLEIDFYRDIYNQTLIKEMNAIFLFIEDDEVLTKMDIVFKTFKYGQKILGIVKTKDGYWNIFDKEVKNNIEIEMVFKNEVTNRTLANPYLIVEQSSYRIDKYIGYNFDVIINWYKEHPDALKSIVVISQANDYCEELLNIAFETMDDEILTQAKQIQKLIRTVDDDRLFLNHILVIKRLKEPLTKEENTRLNQLIDSDKAALIIFASYLLNIKYDKVLEQDLTKDEEKWLKRVGII